MSKKIAIEPANGLYVVRADGAVIGETTRALILHEDGYDPVVYFPREDAGIEFLDLSETRTTCPHKGEATHYHIAAESGRIADAAWSYEDPLPDVAEIKGRIAFYPEKATVERV